MIVDKTYSGLDIKTALGTKETIPTRSAFKYSKFDAEKAFNRLQILRRTEEALINGINENANDLPMDLRKKYDRIAVLMEELEHEEVQLIAFGE